jgi:hypothetical protein
MTPLGTLTEEMADEAMARATALEVSQGQSAINGATGWQGVFCAVAGACDALKATLAEKAGDCGVSIVLPAPLDGFGALRTYAGRAGYVGGMGDMCALLSELATVADDFWQACVTLGIPGDRLPLRDQGSWVATCAVLVPQNKWQMFLALFARGLLDLAGVVSSWQPAPAETAPPRRKRA